MCFSRGRNGSAKRPPSPGPNDGRHQHEGNVKAPSHPPPWPSAASPNPQASTAPLTKGGPAPAYSSGEHVPPVHDWQTAVPDTSLFPPPPSFFSSHDRSHTTNAPEAEAEAGEDWCRQHPPAPPLTLDEAGHEALRTFDVMLVDSACPGSRLTRQAKGHWKISTLNGASDRCVMGYPPLYLVTGNARATAPTTIYYEIKLHSNSPNTSVGIGFTALPYPSFRMPGWHRGSLAVHGDDGHRYINDRWGGQDFVDEFRRGDTYGIGMTLTPAAARGKRRVDVFMTHNGVRVGGWDLHEETDAQSELPVTGLEGADDLSCAIGTFDAVSIDVMMHPDMWMYREAADAVKG